MSERSFNLVLSVRPAFIVLVATLIGSAVILFGGFDAPSSFLSFVAVATLVVCSIALISFRLSLPTVQKGILNRFKIDSVSDLLALAVLVRMTIGLVLLCCCCIVAAIRKDAYLFVVLTVVITMLFSYSALTAYRIERGWFGTNRVEALELLEFIVAKSKTGNIPPGTPAIRNAVPTRAESYEEEYVRSGAST